mmetsp:Transcript_10578/g.25851  ORF Transcript_10578/g.25851 Transcript_10578/m.25851 type:complete len:998 (+) Transcript_10578:119-3112(+)|eukprot:CAMPEP_0114509128 /NCGR_PEP_ID=MMETSP0109-20121206/13028_1 /TAXON_ID=29199 /ORGANISM="Chlorarachnion reptans, Strain CCCM449" /LENGTH=997 /DNA_ID=CAMNT_0001688227 /DNA_START=112 /DNA_END=3105 /DNA_ORIENTATION=-
MDSKLSGALMQQLREAGERLKQAKREYEMAPTEKRRKDFEIAQQAHNVAFRNLEFSKMLGEEGMGMPELEAALKSGTEALGNLGIHIPPPRDQSKKNEIFLKLPIPLVYRVHWALERLASTVEAQHSEIVSLRTKVAKVYEEYGVDVAQDSEPESDVKLYTSSTKATRKMDGDERRWETLLAAKGLKYEKVYLDVYPERWSELAEATEGEKIPLPVLYIRGHIFNYDEVQTMEDAGVQGGRWQSALRLLRLHQPNTNISSPEVYPDGTKSANKTSASQGRMAKLQTGVAHRIQQQESAMLALIDTEDTAEDGKEEGKLTAEGESKTDFPETEDIDDGKKSSVSARLGENKNETTAISPSEKGMATSVESRDGVETDQAKLRRFGSDGSLQSNLGLGGPSHGTQGNKSVTIDMLDDALGMLDDDDDGEKDDELRTPRHGVSPKSSNASPAIDLSPDVVKENRQAEASKSDVPPEQQTPSPAPLITLEPPPGLPSGHTGRAGGRRGRERSRSPSAHRMRSRSPRPTSRSREKTSVKTEEPKSTAPNLTEPAALPADTKSEKRDSATFLAIPGAELPPDSSETEQASSKTRGRSRSRSATRSRSRSPRPSRTESGANETQVEGPELHDDEKEAVSKLLDALGAKEKLYFDASKFEACLPPELPKEEIIQMHNHAQGLMSVKQLQKGIRKVKQKLLEKGLYRKDGMVESIEKATQSLQALRLALAMQQGGPETKTVVDEPKEQEPLGKAYDNVPKSGSENWGKWSQPDAKQFNVRDVGYALRKKKCPSEKFLFPLQHVEFIKVEGNTSEGQPAVLNNVCGHSGSWWATNKPSKEAFALVFNIQVSSIGISAVMYHILPDGLAGLEKICPRVATMLKSVMNSNDTKEIDGRFKFIPRVVSGPFIVRCAVKETPVIMGQKVEQKYFSDSSYFEIDVHVDSSYAANAIIKLAHAYSVNIEVDMVWLLEAKEEEELPERLLAGARLSNVDFSKVYRKLEVQSERE